MSFPVPLPSTFMPLPLAIMIPFMGMQSGVMAQQFGMNFQYGKRKISAMSNEEFNKLTPEQMQIDFANQIKGFIPTFEQSLKDMRPFQRMIFVEMLAAFKEAVQLGIDVGAAGADQIAHLVGGHIGHGATSDPVIDEHKFLSPIQQRAHIRHGHRQEIENRYGKSPVTSPPTPPPTPPPTRTKTISTRMWSASIKDQVRRIDIPRLTLPDAKQLLIQYTKARDTALKAKQIKWYHHMRENIRILDYAIKNKF